MLACGGVARRVARWWCQPTACGVSTKRVRHPLLHLLTCRRWEAHGERDVGWGGWMPTTPYHRRLPSCPTCLACLPACPLLHAYPVAGWFAFAHVRWCVPLRLALRLRICAVHFTLTTTALLPSPCVFTLLTLGWHYHRVCVPHACPAGGAGCYDFAIAGLYGRSLCLC